MPNNAFREEKGIADNTKRFLQSTESADLIESSCPVCRFTLAAPFFYAGRQPLATLGWPDSSEKAKALPTFSLDYVQCPRCTHVWNRAFCYSDIDYVVSPNRMYNKGLTWQGHVKQTRDLLVRHLPTNPTVIEIGCGEGHFLRGIADAFKGKGRFIGFDPNASANGEGIEFYPRYFEPLADQRTFEPDLIVMRHVLEHLDDHAQFLDKLAWAAELLKKPVLFFAEMPCIDKAIESRRLVDYYYEHPSQFTTQSFNFLMSSRAKAILYTDHGYSGEVVFGLIELGMEERLVKQATESKSFYDQSLHSLQTIRSQLDGYASQGKSIAIWGGTGKAAAFMHIFNVDVERFPLVVDSDPEKIGTYVPKTGQLIQAPEILKLARPDVIIIPAQWRAQDIVNEMEGLGFQPNELLVEHRGMLVAFHQAKIDSDLTTNPEYLGLVG